MADATHASESLQQFRALLGSDTRNVLELARAGAHARTTRAHAGDREPVRFVTYLCDQHQRRRIASEIDLRPAVGEDQFLEADLAPFALLDADDARQLDAEF